MAEIETAKMSERGQIIIPKEIRDYLGAAENTIFTLMPLDRETILMKKLDRLKVVQEFERIRENIKEKLGLPEINEEIAEVRRLKRERGQR
jgi:AbrB family looped-hinge helix DNA binding protein